MERERRYSHRDDHGWTQTGSALAPGRRSLTQSFGPVRLDRSAADDRGLERDADAKVSAAASASGAAGLPGELRDRLEGSLGVGLGDVRVHTGEASASAAASIHARAYAVGQDIHFGAHQYAPGTPSGDYLIAHEVAHTVQQRGGVGGVAMDSLDVSAPGDAHELEAEAFAHAFSRGERAPVTTGGASVASRQIMRYGEDEDGAAWPAGLPRVASTIPDMAEVNWGGTAEVMSPDHPAVAWTPTITTEPPPAPRRPIAAPREPDWNAPGCGPSHHADTRDPFHSAGMDAAIEDMDRRSAWERYRSDAMQLSSSWNTTAALDNEFELTESSHEEELRDVHNFRITAGEGDTHSVGNAQPAGRTGGDNPLTVGDLFHNDRLGSRRISTGTELEISAAGERGIDRAAGHVNDEAEAVRAADADLRHAVGEVQTAASDVRAREAGVQAALARIETTHRRREHEAATAAVADVTSDIQSTKDTVKAVLDVVEMLAGQAAGATAPATILRTTAEASTAHSAAEHAGDIAGSSVTELIANRIIDAAYAERLSAAQADLSRASGRLEAAVDTEERALLQTARLDLIRALDSVRARREAVTSALAQRRRAYEALANAAARRSGAAPGSRAYNEVRGAIAAIPIVDTLVSRAQAARDAAVVPVYSGQSGQGLGVATYHGLSHATEFVHHVGYTRRFHSLYEEYFRFWNARRQSLQGVMDRIEDNH